MSTGYILTTGSRIINTPMRGIIHREMFRLLAKAKDDGVAALEIIFGDADGADGEVANWVKMKRGFPVTPHEGSPFVADWNTPCDDRCAPDHRITRWDKTTYCPAQGPYRNETMVDITAQYHEAGLWVCVAAFYNTANSKGTKNCVGLARAKGLPVREFGNVPGKIR